MRALMPFEDAEQEGRLESVPMLLLRAPEAPIEPPARMGQARPATESSNV
jgi:hypothetical protein